jgi:hypothetical protein
MNKIAIIDYLAGEVTVNGSKAHEGQQLKYSDSVDASKGSCVLKFLKSMRLEDISKLPELNIGTMALLHEKMIVIKNG